MTLPAVQPPPDVHACGVAGCRLCVVFGFAERRRTKPRAPRPYKHHPLKSTAAVQRADAIHAFMLAYQAQHGAPPTSKVIAPMVGLSSPGLVRLYILKLVEGGRARLRSTARSHACWEAVA